MYKKSCSQILMPGDFFLPFGGKLNKDNRWCQMALAIPWWEFEDRYSSFVKSFRRGEKAFTVRTALGALIIQNKFGYTDEEMPHQIMENPYLQYFLGFDKYNDSKPPFDSSLMVHFRKRLDKSVLIEVNEIIAKDAAAKAMPHKKDDDSSGGGTSTGSGEGDDSVASGNDEPENHGFLILDATCAPSDIRYPTDLRLLNEAREKLEDIIDTLHAPDAGKVTKPRTYREKARQAYLSVEKQRKKHKKTIRKAIGKQLCYVKRDLKTIARYQADQSRYELLSKRQKQYHKTIEQLYQQQLTMYRSGTHTVENRIVSISQPHIRPIVRGKAGADVEFGSKIMTSVVNGYSFIEKMSFEPFNEGVELAAAVERYKARFGFYPEAVLADTIFRNRENRKWLKDRGIRMSGPALGRPTKDKPLEESKRKLEKKESGMRNAIEGSYGVGKLKYGLGLIRTKLAETTESSIVLQFLIMNLERKLRLLLRLFGMYHIYPSRAAFEPM